DVAAYARTQMSEGSTGYVDRAAREATNTAIAEGRDAEIQAQGEQIALVVYSAVLDANTCGPCAEADGETGQPGDITPVSNPQCPCGAECRCIHLALLWN